MDKINILENVELIIKQEIFLISVHALAAAEMD